MENKSRTSTTCERLRLALDNKGISASELSRRTGLNRSTLSRYLSGEYEPKQEATYKMAKVLGVSEMWLWGMDVPMGRTVEQKKNDDLAEVIALMRKDADLLADVCLLSKLPAAQRAGIRQLMATLVE